MAKDYALRIPKAIEDRLLRCTGSMRQAISERLQEIARAAAQRTLRPASVAKKEGPALRFYVFEGYRIFYRLDRDTRSVIVTGLRPEAA
jgi:mRNA-degrading endonuclease RelE of RelBE toxin-antitoxin system